MPETNAPKFNWATAQSAVVQEFVATKGEVFEDPTMPDATSILASKALAKVTFDLAATVTPELLLAAFETNIEASFQKLLLSLYFYGVTVGVKMERQRNETATLESLYTFDSKDETPNV